MRTKDKIILVLISIGTTIMAFIPLWFYLIGKWMLAPRGFWQNLVLAGFGIYLFGMIQIILIILLVVFLASLWSEALK